MTIRDLIKMLEPEQLDIPVIMGCLDDDSGQSDYELQPKDVSVQPLQSGHLGGSVGSCLNISYRSGK